MRALVLSGGGSKGAWQLGVLQRWMGEEGRDYEIMAGVSVGALNIAGLNQTPFGHPKQAIDNVTKMWLTQVETKKIYKRWYPFGRLHSLWTKSVYDSEPLVELIKKNIDTSKIRNSGRQVIVGAVCLETGEQRFVDQHVPGFEDWILASSSFPIFLQPIQIEGKLWSDGAIKNVTPLGQAIDRGATEIDVLLTTNLDIPDVWVSKKKVAVPDQIVRALSLMNDQIMQNDIEITRLKNNLTGFDPKYKKIKIRVVMPSTSLISNSLNFEPSELKRMFDQGRNDADNIVVYD